MSAWLDGLVSDRQDWADGLMTLRIDAEIEPFRAGQWLNLGLRVDGELVRRAYSLASAPGSPPEFYLTRVSTGSFTPRLFDLELGDEIAVERQPQGFFTLEYVPDVEELWMVATGTGLGPFIAMLRTNEPWERFKRIVLVHGVRTVEHLSYREELEERSKSHDARLTWVPVVSREPDAPSVVHGRVTSSLQDGELEKAAGLTLSPERSHVMLCGNPEMIADMTKLLEQREMRRHRKRRPGHISSENYW